MGLTGLMEAATVVMIAIEAAAAAMAAAATETSIGAATEVKETTEAIPIGAIDRTDAIGMTDSGAIEVAAVVAAAAGAVAQDTIEVGIGARIGAGTVAIEAAIAALGTITEEAAAAAAAGIDLIATVVTGWASIEADVNEST